MAVTPSPNFSFLANIDQVIVDVAARAELYVFTDPNSALIKTRQFGELLVKLILAKQGRTVDENDTQLELINELWQRRIVPDRISQMFHEVRKKGNQAVHDVHGDKSEALFHVKTIYRLGVWYYKTFHDRHYKPKVFAPPPEPVDASEVLRAELDALRTEYSTSQVKLEQLAESVESETELRRKAEAQAKEAYAELETVMEIGVEDNARLTAKIDKYEALLAENVEAVELSEEEIKETVEFGFSVEAEIVTEADTREIIDRQLRAVGWTVDSKAIRHSKGSRPQKNKNIAISEWPTSSGPAD